MAVLGFRLGVFGCSGARWHVRWRPSASGSFGIFRAGPGVAPCGIGWLGNGVRRRRRWLGGQACRAVWRAGLLWCCGCRRRRCADAFGVARVCVCVRGWALGDVPQADAVSLRLLEGLPQAPEDVRVVLGRGGVAGVDSQGVERIGKHGFPCGLRHPPPLPSQPRAHPCHPPRVPPEGERCCAVRDRHPPLSCTRATQPQPRSPFPGFAPLPHRHIPRAYSWPCRCAKGRAVASVSTQGTPRVGGPECC